MTLASSGTSRDLLATTIAAVQFPTYATLLYIVSIVINMILLWPPLLFHQYSKCFLHLPIISTCSALSTRRCLHDKASPCKCDATPAKDRVMKPICERSLANSEITGSWPLPFDALERATTTLWIQNDMQTNAPKVSYHARIQSKVDRIYRQHWSSHPRHFKATLRRELWPDKIVQSLQRPLRLLGPRRIATCHRVQSFTSSLLLS